MSVTSLFKDQVVSSIFEAARQFKVSTKKLQSSMYVCSKKLCIFKEYARMFIPHICHQHHQRCWCQNVHDGVKNSSNNGYFTTATTLVVVEWWWSWWQHRTLPTSRISLFCREISCDAIYAFLVSNFRAGNGAGVKK